MVRLILAACAIAACGYDASYGDCAIHCSTDTGCPDGLTCGAEGRCRSPGDIEICAEGPDAFDPIGCPATYTISLPSSTSRYRLVSGGLDWTNASAACAANQTSPTGFTHLVVFAERQEQTDLEAIVDDVWVGYSDRRVEGEFIAVTREPIGDYGATNSPAWAVGEPNAGVNENCAEILLEGGLNDNNCTLPRRFVCECDGYANDPTRTDRHGPGAGR